MVHKCVENIEADDIIEKSQVHGDRLCVLSQKMTDHHVSVSITRLLFVSYLFERYGLCPISSLISIQ